MDDRVSHPANARTGTPTRRKRERTAGSAVWRRLRQPLAQSHFAKKVFSGALAQAMRFIRLTNPLAKGSMAHPSLTHEPAIIAMWHGQHFLLPAFYVSRRRLVAMVSKSADAEMNALVLERFGIETVRGSGGRRQRKHLGKGGTQALVSLKRALDGGSNVAMIADIPHGKPRDAGMGIVLLAKASGRPIVPVAMATSRRRVLERTWDKSTINLPFGRSALGYGPMISVPGDADDAVMEEKRRDLTAALDQATEAAYALVDRRRRRAA